MIEMKLLQSLGNVAARTVEYKYPNLEIRFFALKDAAARIYVATRGDSSGRTGRLFEIGALPETATSAVKDMSILLETRIDAAVREFTQGENARLNEEAKR